MSWETVKSIADASRWRTNHKATALNEQLRLNSIKSGNHSSQPRIIKNRPRASTKSEHSCFISLKLPLEVGHHFNKY